MLYILPRVVLQVKASLYYKTINNKQKKPKFHLFYPPPWLLHVLGMGEVGATGSRRSISSCPASPGPPAHGGCHLWFIDAKKLCQSPCPTLALARMAEGHRAWSRLDFGIASTLSASLCLARLPRGWAVPLAGGAPHPEPAAGPPYLAADAGSRLGTGYCRKCITALATFSGAML